MSTQIQTISHATANSVVAHLMLQLRKAVQSKDPNDLVLYYELNASIMKNVSWEEIPQKVLDTMLEARVLIFTLLPYLKLSDDHLAFTEPTGFEIFIASGSVIVQTKTIEEAIAKAEQEFEEKVITFRLADGKVPVHCLR